MVQRSSCQKLSVPSKVCAGKKLVSGVHLWIKTKEFVTLRKVKISDFRSILLLALVIYVFVALCPITQLNMGLRPYVTFCKQSAEERNAGNTESVCLFEF